MNANDISKIEELEKTIKEAQRQIEEIKEGDKKFKMKEGDHYVIRDGSNGMYIETDGCIYNNHNTMFTWTKSSEDFANLMNYMLILAKFKDSVGEDLFCYDGDYTVNIVGINPNNEPHRCISVNAWDNHSYIDAVFMFEKQENCEKFCKILNGEIKIEPEEFDMTAIIDKIKE